MPVPLNVGGVRFTTSITTLRTAPQGSFLRALCEYLEGEGAESQGAAENSVRAGQIPIERDGDGAVFVDREGALFRPVLHLMRTGDWCPELIGEFKVSKETLLKECEFYGVRPPTIVNASDESLRILLAEHREAGRRRKVDELGPVGVQLMQRIVRALVGAVGSEGKLSAMCHSGYANFERNLLESCGKNKKDEVLKNLPNLHSGFFPDDAELPDEEAQILRRGAGAQDVVVGLRDRYDISMSITRNDYGVMLQTSEYPQTSITQERYVKPDARFCQFERWEVRWTDGGSST
jgi:BTB/POZ domain